MSNDEIEYNGYKFFRDGKVFGKKGKSIGRIGPTGELVFTMYDDGKYMKTAVAICALFKNNGEFPKSIRDWKITYKDGNKLNCSADNLEFESVDKESKLEDIEGFKPVYKSLIADLKKALQLVYDSGYRKGSSDATRMQTSEINQLKRMIVKEKRDRELIDKYNKRIEENKKMLEEKMEIVKKKTKQKIEDLEIYLIDIVNDDYEISNINDLMTKFDIDKNKVISLYRSHSLFKGRYCLTTSLGDIWDLQAQYANKVVHC